MFSIHRIFFLAVVTSFVLATGCRDREKEPVEEKPILTEEEHLCEDACVFAKDGECDDGGPGATTGYCEFGKDCSDCGKRVVIKVKK